MGVRSRGGVAKVKRVFGRGRKVLRPAVNASGKLFRRPNSIVKFR